MTSRSTCCRPPSWLCVRPTCPRSLSCLSGYATPVPIVKYAAPAVIYEVLVTTLNPPCYYSADRDLAEYLTKILLLRPTCPRGPFIRSSRSRYQRGTCCHGRVRRSCIHLRGTCGSCLHPQRVAFDVLCAALYLAILAVFQCAPRDARLASR